MQADIVVVDRFSHRAHERPVRFSLSDTFAHVSRPSVINCIGRKSFGRGLGFASVVPIIGENNSHLSEKPSSAADMPGQGGRLRLPSLGTDSNASGNSVSQLQKEHRRVVMMGSAKVGKSSIISQFLYDKYLSKYRETVEELHRGEYVLPDGASLTLDILDTSGAYQFPAMRALSISTADAFILVFAVDNADSWEEVRKLREQIIEARGHKIPIVVVGNKTDLESQRVVGREVSESTAAFEWECGYTECSAKDNVNIIDVFKEVLVQARIRYNLSPAVRRRRQSLPNYVTGGSAKSKHMLKRNSCTVA